MEEVSAIFSNIDILNYTDDEEETSTTWNARTVTTKSQRSYTDKQITKILNDMNHRFEQTWCMSRCTASRDVEIGVSMKRDEEGKTSGNLEFEAPSEDGKDNFISHIKVDDKGNVSGEFRYKCKTGSKNK